MSEDVRYFLNQVYGIAPHDVVVSDLICEYNLTEEEAEKVYSTYENEV